MTEKTEFTYKEQRYFRTLNDFYKKCEPNSLDKMLKIISGSDQISLRILDWFVTKYSSKVVVLIPQKNNDPLNVHIGYKAQLKTYKKKYFDPFKRRAKFSYTFPNTNKTIETTLGQLNFFSWAIGYQLIEYVNQNFEKITEEMNISNKEDKIKKKEKVKVTKADLDVTSYSSELIISFN